MTTIYSRVVAEDIELGVGTVQVVLPGGATTTGSRVGIKTIAYGQAITSSVQGAGLAVAAGQSQSFNIPVTGAALGDFAVVSCNISLGALIQTVSVEAGVAIVRYYNPTNALISVPTSVTIYVAVFKFQ